MDATRLSYRGGHLAARSKPGFQPDPQTVRPSPGWVRWLVHFFDLPAWLVAARWGVHRNSLTMAFGPNNATGEEKRRETDDHQTPDDEHLPIRMIGFVTTRDEGSRFDRASLKIPCGWRHRRHVGRGCVGRQRFFGDCRWLCVFHEFTSCASSTPSRPCRQRNRERHRAK